MNTEKLNKLYEGIISGDELTTKNLNSYGFSSKEINSLIEAGIIERVQRGIYKFLSVEHLFQYGMSFRKVGDHDKANTIFKHCLKFDPNHWGSARYLFSNAIYNTQWNDAFEYLKILMNSASIYTRPDYSTYLFLLNRITDLPKEYQTLAKSYTIKDFLLAKNDDRYKDKPAQNKIISAILNQKFIYAFKLLREEIAQNNNVANYRDFIIRNLLYNVCAIENKFVINMLELIKCEEYEELIAILKQKCERCNLSQYETTIFKLVTVLMEIIKSGQVTNKETSESEYSTVFDAIEACDYLSALNLSKQHNQTRQTNNAGDAIYLLLEAIVNKIHELTSPKIEEKKVEEPKIESNITILDVLNCLLVQDIEGAHSAVKAYLQQLNKPEYSFLVLNLIKLSVFEQDAAFTKPMLALTNITNNKFEFNMAEYIQAFYTSLSQKKFEEARIYLDIMAKANKLGYPEVAIEALNKILNSQEQIVEVKEKGHQVEISHESKKPVEPEPVPVVPTKSPELKPMSIKEQPKLVAPTPRNSEVEFIDAKYAKLTQERGVILLKPMNAERRKNIHRLMIKYSNMESFSIGEGEERRVVLRYTEPGAEFISFKKLLREAKSAYIAKDYQVCIDNCLKVLSVSKNPPASVYAHLGLAHMKLFQLRKAIDYLTIASIMGKGLERPYEFDDLIARLKGDYDKENAKPEVKMHENEFKNDLDNNYGITNIDEINKLVTIEGKSITEACLDLGLSEADANIVKLIYARDYYAQGDSTYGDLFVKAVIKSPVKNEAIIKILDEIKRNKKFYSNRVEEVRHRLSLTIKP